MAVSVSKIFESANHYPKRVELICIKERIPNWLLSQAKQAISL